MQTIGGRIPSLMGPEAYKSYSVRAPLSTHWRPATCEEFLCDDYVYGFVLSVDTSTELGQRQWDYVTHDKTRKFSKQRVGTTMWKIIYPPGNAGFAGPRHEHRIQIGRPPFLLVAEGDWRGNPRGIPTRVHRNYEDWVDDMATHQEILRMAAEG